MARKIMPMTTRTICVHQIEKRTHLCGGCHSSRAVPCLSVAGCAMGVKRAVGCDRFTAKIYLALRRRSECRNRHATVTCAPVRRGRGSRGEGRRGHLKTDADETGKNRQVWRKAEHVTLWYHAQPRACHPHTHERTLTHTE
jgi:hypothetical protein